MRIVLVGGAGFIGHHLAGELIKHGHEVFVIDSLGVNNLHTVENDYHKRFLQDRLHILTAIGAEMIYQDARDYSMLSNMILSIKPDCIVQLAAVAHMNRARKTPLHTYDHSIKTLENALDIAVQSGIALDRPAPKFIYFSSSTIYGDWTSEKAVETQHCNPFGTYARLKNIGENLVKSYNEDWGLEYAIIRPSALYGDRCISGRVLQIFIEAAMNGKPLTVKGNEKLDFTYIRDLVQGVRLAIESDIVNETYNITYGEGVPVAYAAELIGTEFGAKVEYSDEVIYGPERGTLDISKARQMLGYDPRFDIDKGLGEYIAWYKRFGKNS